MKRPCRSGVRLVIRRGLGDTLIDMGNFSDDRGDHDLALKTFKEALDLERDLSNEGMQAICLNNIGTVYSEKGQFEDSLPIISRRFNSEKKRKCRRTLWRLSTIWVRPMPTWANTIRRSLIICEHSICGAA